MAKTESGPLGIRDGRMFYSRRSSTKVVLSEQQVIWIIGNTTTNISQWKKEWCVFTDCQPKNSSA